MVEILPIFKDSRFYIYWLMENMIIQTRTNLNGWLLCNMCKKDDKKEEWYPDAPLKRRSC